METKAVTVGQGNTALPDVIRQNITDSIMNEVKELELSGRLQFPENYSYQNALKSAWLILQDVVDRNNKPALEVCTQVSIANALMDMIIQGLSPAKKQCYFIVRGNKLCLDRSYFGAIHVAKQVTNMIDVVAEPIREGQDFEFDIDPKTGFKHMIHHKAPFNTLNNEIIGAYCVKIFPDGKDKLEVMTREDIQKAWEQGPMKGKSGAHINFEGEMCKKTVINRACKIEINTSSDSDIVIAAVNRTIEGEFDNMRIDAEVKQVEETEELANTILGIKQPEPDPVPEQKKPALSDKSFDAALKRIDEGQTDVINKLEEYYTVSEKQMEVLKGRINTQQKNRIDLDIQTQIQHLCQEHGKDLEEVLINFGYSNIKEVDKNDVDSIVKFIKDKNNA